MAGNDNAATTVGPRCEPSLINSWSHACMLYYENVSRVYVLVACGPQRDSLVSEFTKMYCEQIIILCSWSVVGFGSICLIRGPSLCFSPNFGSEHWQTKFRRLAARAPPRLTLFALDDPAAAVELGLCAETVHRR